MDKVALFALKDQLDRISMEQSYTNDPVERVVGDALANAGMPFEHERHPNRQDETGRRLDFKIVDEDLFIEVKRMYSDRSNAQLATAENVILIQGIDAAKWFADILDELAELRKMKNDL